MGPKTQTLWIAGTSIIGSMTFGCAFVAGRNRVPSPAARTIARIDPLVPVVIRLEGPADRHAEESSMEEMFTDLFIPTLTFAQEEFL